MPTSPSKGVVGTTEAHDNVEIMTKVKADVVERLDDFHTGRSERYDVTAIAGQVVIECDMRSALVKETKLKLEIEHYDVRYGHSDRELRIDVL
jgi:hypothetical protein